MAVSVLPPLPDHSRYKGVYQNPCAAMRGMNGNVRRLSRVDRKSVV